MNGGIVAGECVILTLGDPREQVFGMLLEIGAAGIVVRGLSVSSVDDWLRELDGGPEAIAGGVGLSTTFYPMHRVERMSLDEPSYGAPPIHERFRQRMRLSFADFIRDEGSASGDE